MVPGRAGAKDLVAGAKHVIVALIHTGKGGPKIAPRCSLPLTAARRISLIVTELAVIEPTAAGLVLREARAEYQRRRPLRTTEPAWVAPLRFKVERASVERHRNKNS